jgi:hypothetical protein
MTGHDFPAVITVGQVGVVGAAHQPDVLDAVITTQAERVPVVELEPVALLAPSALIVHVPASLSVTLTDGTLDGRGNVAGGGRRARRRLLDPWGALAGSLRSPHATCLEPFEFLGDGLLDDRRQVAVAPF